ncbi:hypothetical protein THIOKS12330032 [Thiocapsa sp. KS1]|nr:hypothetical protein THIOKS12330032 [Thiocapsa sp. KS1]
MEITFATVTESPLRAIAPLWSAGSLEAALKLNEIAHNIPTSAKDKTRLILLFMTAPLLMIERR